jgi:hypothetical protein
MRGTNGKNGRTYRPRGLLGRTRRFAAAGVGSGATLIALAMMMAPVAAAHAPVTYSAPFLKSVKVITNNIDASGCAKVYAKKMTFSTTTGMGVWAGKAAAKSCPRTLGPVGGQSYAQAQGETLVGVPIKAFFGAATATTVTVTWSISAVASIAVVNGAGACPPAVVNSAGYGYSYCFLEAGAEMFGYSYLLDLTNGTYFYPSNYPTLINLYNYTYNDTYCYSFTCYSYNYSAASPTSSWSGTNTATWWINGTLNHADKYAVETYVYAYAFGEVYNFPKSSAVGSIDMASVGHGLTLASIVVS